ncbi:apoptosis inducing factor BLCAP [Panulirus ornatus]|uniref:apoptosis inducing factor BLCAP n=1 Tax=Panulirus ornatus TaxID=150431 RepID=UPI003A83D4E5
MGISSHSFWSCRRTMYCLQWLIPVLLIPKPVPAGLLHNHVVFMVLYLTGFFLERKPCTICSLVFLAAVTVLCYSGIGNCLLWPTADCQGESSGSNELCGRGG